jgi:hypothetical protein
MDIWSIFNILCPFVTFCGNFVFFPPFWYFAPKKIWRPCRRLVFRRKIVERNDPKVRDEKTETEREAPPAGMADSVINPQKSE